MNQAYLHMHLVGMKQNNLQRSGIKEISYRIVRLWEMAYLQTSHISTNHSEHLFPPQSSAGSEKVGEQRSVGVAVDADLANGSIPLFGMQKEARR